MLQTTPANATEAPTTTAQTSVAETAPSSAAVSNQMSPLWLALPLAVVALAWLYRQMTATTESAEAVSQAKEPVKETKVKEPRVSAPSAEDAAAIAAARAQKAQLKSERLAAKKAAMKSAKSEEKSERKGDSTTKKVVTTSSASSEATASDAAVTAPMIAVPMAESGLAPSTSAINATTVKARDAAKKKQAPAAKPPKPIVAGFTKLDRYAEPTRVVTDMTPVVKQTTNFVDREEQTEKRPPRGGQNRKRERGSAPPRSNTPVAANAESSARTLKDFISKSGDTKE